MRVGVIVDGVTEVHATALLVAGLPTRSQIVKVLLADLHPNASALKIAAVAAKSAEQLIPIGIDFLIVLIDLEERDVCPGVWSAEVETHLKRAWKYCPAAVVIKVRTFENWLLGDPEAINRHLGTQFLISNTDMSNIRPNQADNVHAISVLKRSTSKGVTYDKVGHGVQIASVIDPREVARNSRSFRRFLRVLKVVPYSKQSKKPATGNILLVSSGRFKGKARPLRGVRARS